MKVFESVMSLSGIVDFGKGAMATGFASEPCTFRE